MLSCTPFDADPADRMLLPRTILRQLRDTALQHDGHSHPDLALMARELGATLHRNHATLHGALADPKAAPPGFRRWRLTPRRRRGTCVMLVAWPGDHQTPVHDHGGMWGLELVLHGALEVQAYRRDGDDMLRTRPLSWLGPGDALWFDDHGEDVHRCRNLSRDHSAWTLQVHGGLLDAYRAYRPRDADGLHWVPRQQRTLARELAL